MKKIIVWMCLGIGLLPGLSVADEVQTETPGLAQRVEALEAQLKNLDTKSDEWTDSIKIKGDLRYRQEMIKSEGGKTRNRNRIRARLGVEAEVNPTLSAVLQLASGSDDPVSTNQTLDGGFSKKPVWIDLAYFDWKPGDKTDLHVIGGKIQNPFYQPGKTELIWDGDLRPEGGAMTYATKGESVSIFTNLGGFWIKERGSEADTGLFGAQAGAKVALPFLGEKSNLTAGASYYDYGNVKGKSPIYDPTKAFGNVVDVDGNMQLDYDLIEAFIDLGFALGKTPASLFGDFVSNTAPGVKNNQGWLAGLTLGKCKDPHSWALRYNYRNLESDAVLGVFTDSDFGGGGTDGKGHEVGFDYMLAKRWEMGLTYFHNQTGISAKEKDYQRFQFDLAAKF